MIFTEQPTEDDSNYDRFFELSRKFEDSKFAIHFTASYVLDDTKDLLTNRCPECKETFRNFDLLASHTREEHNKNFCEICAQHKKAFVSELSLYTEKGLQRHLNTGDGKGFPGHPKCKFCRRKRFYSEDELNLHVRDRHERCYLCDQDGYLANAYYKDYDDLYAHFQDRHYVCSVPVCVEKRFVVFRDDLDLTGHMLQEHGGLAGSNGRVVLGLAPRFQLRLTEKKPLPETGSDTAERKRRLEERAKHYLHNDAAKLKEFSTCNQSFKSGRLNARQLLADYRKIFSESSREEVSLMIYDLAELYSKSSGQRTQLEEVYDEIAVKASVANNFPALGLPEQHVLGWGPGLVHQRARTDELFPMLSRPKKLSVQVVKNAPIRYTTITQPRKPESKKPVIVRLAASSPAPLPNYLDSGSRSTSSLPNAVRSASPSKAIDNSRFPALAKKTSKKPIPRVTPIAAGSGSWGATLSAPSTPVEDWGIPIVDKKAEKMKMKAARKR